MDKSTSLLKALDLLTVLGGAKPDGHTVQSLAEIMNLPRTTVIRILNTIVDYGLVRREGRQYLTTQAFTHWSLANRNAAHSRRYREALAQIAKATGELVLLGILEGAGIVHIDYIESDHRVQVAPAPQTHHSIRRNALGKLILSQREDLAEPWVEQEPEFAEELIEIRTTGIAWNRGETVSGMIAMATHGAIAAATEPKLVVAWPKERFSERKAKRALKAIADALSLLADHSGKK